MDHFLVFVLVLSHVLPTLSTLITITETNRACTSRRYAGISSSWNTQNATSTATLWSTQGGTATPSANGGPTLVPGPAPSSSPGDLDHLTPNTTGTMYYCASTTLESCSEMMVQLNATFNFPTVIVEHSAYITRIVWSESQLDLYFNSVGAYNFIKQSWNLPEASLVPRDLTTPFVLASTAQESTGNQRDYFLVNKVHYDDSNMKVSCYGTTLDLEGAVDDLGIQWGSYTPGNNASSELPSSSLSSTIAATTPAPQTSLTTFVTVIPESTAVTTEALSSPYPTFVTVNSTSESSTLIVRTPPPVTITQTSEVTFTQTTSIVSTLTMTTPSIVSTTVQVPTTLLATTTLSAGDPITYTSTISTRIVQPTTIAVPTTIVATTILDGGVPYTYTTVSTTSVVQSTTIEVPISTTIVRSTTVEVPTTIVATTTLINGDISTSTLVSTTSVVETTTVEVPSTIISTTTAVSDITSTYTSTVSTTIVQPTTIVQTSLSTTEVEVTTSTTTYVSTYTPEPMTITSVSTYSTSIVVVTTESASTYTTTIPPQTVTITSTVDSCGSYPSSTTSGMPAATCGSDFDRRLDAQYGYYDFSADNGSQIDEFAPGANLTQEDLGYSNGNNTMSKRDMHLLRKRGFWSSLKKVASAVTSAVKTVTAAAVSVTKNIPIVGAVVQTVAKQVNTIVDVASTAVSLITNQPTTAGVKFTLPIGMKAPNNDESPWGPAYKIFECAEACGAEDKGNKETVASLWEKNGLLPALNALGVEEEPEPGIRVYCVNCGVDGSFSVSGSITVQLSSGVKDAEVSLQGSLHAGVSLGVEFLAVYEREIGRYRLLEVGVPGFSIPGVITVGPQVTLDIAAVLRIEAQGQAIAGFHYYLTGFEQTINFVDRSKSRSVGWTPRVEHVFNAMGSLSATAELGMPVGIVVGVSLLGGKYSLTAGIVDTPSIDFTASYSISIDETGVTMNDGNCNGIEWWIDLKNRIQAVYPGNTLLLGQWNGPTLAKGCLGAKPAQTPPPVVTKRTTTTTTTSSARIITSSTLPQGSSPCGGPIVSNGDFGDSMATPTIAPWQVTPYPSDAGNTWSFTTGYLSSSAIQGNIKRSPSSAYSGLILSQNLTLVPGASYNLSMTFKYGQQTSACYLNAFMDGAYIWSVYDGNMPASVGNWLDNTSPVFTATKAVGAFDIYFTCVSSATNTYYLDNVRFNVVSMPAGVACTGTSSGTPSMITSSRGLGCPNPTPTAFTVSNTIYNYEWCMAYLSPGSVNISPGSLQGCAAMCTGSCVAFNYADSNNCRTMASVASVTTSFYAWSAYSLVGKVTPPSALAVTTTQSSATPTTTVTCGGFGDQSVYTGSDGSTYRIQCGWDYNPGSAGDRARYTTTFQQCIDACVSAGTSCYAASWVPGRINEQYDCYLKGSTFYRQTPGIVVHSVLRLSGPMAKRQEINSETSSAIPAGNTTTPGDLTAIADSNVTFSSGSYDAEAAAAEAAFQVIDVTNSTSTNSTAGFDLPPLNDTLAASANATLELVALINSDNATANDTALDTSVGTSWTTLYDTTETVMLSAGDDGNLYLAAFSNISSENPQTTALFSSAESIVSGDYQSRMFVYFPTSINNYNCSRLRLVDDPYIPATSRIVTLTPFDIGGQAVYVAVDTEGEMFQLAWCTIQGGSPKVFLVSDPDSGPDNLMLEELRWSVTGGIVGNCSTLALSSNDEGLDVGAS